MTAETGSMRRYDLVIFDFDGTLADSGAWMRANLNGVARKFGFKESTSAELDALRAMSNRDIMKNLGVPAWKLPFIATHVRALMARDAHLIAAFEGACELLATLQGAGVALALVSTNSEANVRRILGEEASARIGRYACGAAMFGKAAKFRAVARAEKIDVARTLSVGDEPRDIEAAREAGVASGAVSWGYSTPGALQAVQPDHMFNAMSEISAAVLG